MGEWTVNAEVEFRILPPQPFRRRRIVLLPASSPGVGVRRRIDANGFCLEPTIVGGSIRPHHDTITEDLLDKLKRRVEETRR